MPRRIRKGRKHNKRRVARRKTRIPPSVAVAGRGQSASIIETIQFPDVVSNRPYAYIFNLAQFARASALAPQFQFYKAAVVTWTYEALYNTFQEGSNFAKPYMYTLMDRTQQQLAPSSLAYLQHSGARSVQFTKTQKLTYKPNWVSPGAMAVIYNTDGTLAGINAQGYKKQFDWIETPTSSLNAYTTIGIQDTLFSDTTVGAGNPVPSTSNNKCTYNGHRTYIDQTPSPAEPTLVARVTCTVHWIFKGARYSPMVTQSAPPSDDLLKN